MIIDYFSKFTICLLGFFLFNSLSSCTTQKNHLMKTPFPLSQPASTHISLLPHQSRVIDYLNNNPTIKGILVNHYMGTGKTFLALGFAEQHPQDLVIILAPPYLRNNWRSQMKEFKVHNPSRYQFIGFNDAINNSQSNLFDNKILIIDEAHNFIRALNSDNEKENEKYAALFQKTRHAKRIVALTGTPIYQDVSDIAFLLNLVSGEELLSFNHEQFRTHYSKKIPIRSFWRGNLFESNIFYLTLPVFFSFLSFALFATPIAIIPGAALGASVIPLANNALAPLTHYQLREGDYSKLTDHIEKYVSYFRFENPKSEDFPSKNVIDKSVPYSTAQMDFFLRYIEEDLSSKELIELLKEHQNNVDSAYVMVNSSRINKNLKLPAGNGREIGNLSIPDANNIPPKFIAIAQEIKTSPGKIAIYSNYYHNGIKKFYDYLCSINQCDKAVIINPLDSDKIQEKKINDYNSDDKSVILFTFSEGVSLFKTRQLHIMEPVLNEAIFEQVMGRAVRYRSHASLKESERHVDVFVWQSTLPVWDWQAYQLKRQNWRTRYGELSQYSNWGRGISQIDKNYDQKLFSPDQHTMMNLERLQRNSIKMLKTLKEHSIETRNF